ncbi:multidrug transporter [Haloarchaeobius sp. DT45]|uniref:multidrug transporter n=1 Tax=Haloarchaeobius sp. DT45 TaxID=3446116 RepID=UPI003F6C546C
MHPTRNVGDHLMPGAGRSDSPLRRYVGLAVFAVAMVGWAVAGWDFEFSDGLVPVAIAGGCVLLAVGATLYRRVA